MLESSRRVGTFLRNLAYPNQTAAGGSMTAIRTAHHRNDYRREWHSASRAMLAFCAALLALFLAAALPAAAQDQKDSQQPDNDKDGIGFNLGQNATAKDVGLPIYPGSRRHKDNDEDNSTLNMGLWGGNSGFKLFVMKMETPDSPDKVATFYRKALAKYGTVLDCSNAASSGAPPRPTTTKRNRRKPYPAKTKNRSPTKSR